MKNLRRTLSDGGAVVGTWLNSVSPVMAELMAATGFDFICVDAEHSAVDIHQAQQLFQAISSGNPDCAAFVRLHGVDYPLAKRYLDAGARGIIGPLVNTKDQAQLLVEMAKYPPLGNRGVGFCRANQYGMNLARDVVTANEDILVAAQIEHIEGVRNIDSILSVAGIDAVFIGPYDLSASMGLTGQFDHPEFMAARNRILDACIAHKVVPGLHIIQPNPKELCARAEEGYRLLAYSLDITMVIKASLEGIEAFRASRIQR